MDQLATVKPTRFFKLLLSLLLLSSTVISAQEDSTLVQRFQQHITYLASDELEGRATGSPGERLAYEYIIKEFKAMHITPMGVDGTFLQAFEFANGRELDGKNELRINGKDMVLESDYYPLNLSGNGDIKAKIFDAKYGICAPDIGYNDYPDPKKAKGKIVLIALGSPDGSNNPHSKFQAYQGLQQKIETAISMEVAGIIFYTSEDHPSYPAMDYKKNVTSAEVPVTMLKSAAYKRLKVNKWKDAQMSVHLKKLKNTGHNVIGYINNQAPTTVIFGAHYDHLGITNSHGSLHAGEPEIHNGADDNASGVAIILEMANYLQHSTLNNHNYLFIGFSGEELGLYGSNYFTKNSTIDLSAASYMLNFDMVGRLDSTEKTLGINGIGTSPEWAVLDSMDIDGIQEIKTTQSGVGPSDHTSFYLNDVPAIQFFSGAHNDYHKPTDDEALINYEGMTAIYNYVKELVHELSDIEKIAFTKTEDQSQPDVPRFTVTLGVIPDYLYSGVGLRIDGVKEARPAHKAGIEQGDIVIEMGNIKVPDMMGYMEALSRYKKGDATTVKVKRGEEVLTKEIQF